MSSFPFMVVPGSSLVIYYPYNGRPISRRLPSGVNLLVRRYYDLDSLLWFVEAWYWEPREGFIYFESGPEIHPRAPAVYLVIPPRYALATDGTNCKPRFTGRASHVVSLWLLLASLTYLVMSMIALAGLGAGAPLVVKDVNGHGRVHTYRSSSDGGGNCRINVGT